MMIRPLRVNVCKRRKLFTFQHNSICYRQRSYISCSEILTFRSLSVRLIDIFMSFSFSPEIYFVIISRKKRTPPKTHRIWPKKNPACANQRFAREVGKIFMKNKCARGPARTRVCAKSECANQGCLLYIIPKKGNPHINQNQMVLTMNWISNNLFMKEPFLFLSSNWLNSPILLRKCKL